jgi:adenine-specific DNA-methyltransferase
VRAFTWQPGPEIADFPALCDKRSFPIRQTALRADGWQIECKEVLALLAKLRAAGKPLGEYVKGRFYRGILTGLNEAFVVDRSTRDRLIAEHPSSAEILKPFLRGRDVKRWRCAFAEQYLIKIESSENAKHPWSGMEPKRAEAVFAKSYPAIHAFMAPYRRALIKRADQGKYFWELRSCAYWEAFEQPRIIIPAIDNKCNYALETESYYSNDKTSICVAESPQYVLALLNSRVLWWLIQQTAASKQGGFYEFKPMYVSHLPIPDVSPERPQPLIALVDRILAAKVRQAFLPAGQPSPATLSSSSPSQTGMSAPRPGMSTPSSITALEAEIDRLVYGLYGLTDTEIAIVEGNPSSGDTR